MIYTNEQERIALRKKGITEATHQVALRLVRDWAETFLIFKEHVNPEKLRILAFQVADAITHEKNLHVADVVAAVRKTHPVAICRCGFWRDHPVHIGPPGEPFESVDWLRIHEFRQEREAETIAAPKLEWVLCSDCGRGHWHDPDAKREA